MSGLHALIPRCAAGFPRLTDSAAQKSISGGGLLSGGPPLFMKPYRPPWYAAGMVYAQWRAWKKVLKGEPLTVTDQEWIDKTTISREDALRIVSEQRSSTEPGEPSTGVSSGGAGN